MSRVLPSIYLEAPVLIDLAQEKASLALSKDVQNDVWHCHQALKAARDGKIKLITSGISIAECNSIEKGKPSPPDDIKRFYEMLLASGKSGISLVMPTFAILTKARDLKWNHSLNLKGMDATHLATALHMRCDEIWTRDGRIWNSRVEVGKYGITPLRPHETQALPEAYRQPELLP